MKLLIEHEKANLQFNEETNTIELIWKKFQDEATYKMMFTKGIEYLKEYKATGWLSDIRNEGVVGPGTSAWLQNEIIPKAISYGLKKIAVIMEPDIFKEFYVKNIEKITENKMMQYFDSLEKANEWLKEATVSTAL
jgi:hypothetical protein